MKKNWAVALVVLSLISVIAVPGFAKDTNIISNSLNGEIRGLLESCEPGSRIKGALVYIPGISIMSKTDDKGAFRLLDVPPGRYKLVFEISGQEYFQENVNVSRRQITRLGSIPVCEDCTENVECQDGSFCNKKNGECGGQGVCETIPNFCIIGSYAPVCGCDGMTYKNECLARAAGKNIAHEGRCEPLPPCTENSDCGSDFLYCLKPGGQCEGEGICMAKPFMRVCLAEPVCGCDGKTYSSPCDADRNGISISHKGTCEPLSACMSNSDCGYDYLYCSRPDGQCGGEGVCKAVPNMCLIGSVCGCDGKTYGSECEAIANGADISHRGICLIIKPVPIPLPLPPQLVPVPH
ncbi:MAG: hypothetical protein HZC49_09075 [Nitrospirae bacterium]|nr:hypothetical protein [Nitrospirota bacterium]